MDDNVVNEWMHVAVEARWLELKLLHCYRVETSPPVFQPVESLTDLIGVVLCFDNDTVQLNVASWLSQEGLRVPGLSLQGSGWGDANSFEDALLFKRRCHVMVPVVSSYLYASGSARDELEYAATLGKRIVPVFMEPKKNFEGTWLEPFLEGKKEYRITTSETLDAPLTAFWRRELEGPLGVWKPALEATLVIERARIRDNTGARGFLVFPRDNLGAVDDARRARARAKAWLAEIGVGGGEESSGVLLPLVTSGEVRTLAPSSANVVVLVVQAKASVML